MHWLSAHLERRAAGVPAVVRLPGHRPRRVARPVVCHPSRPGACGRAGAARRRDAVGGRGGVGGGLSRRGSGPPGPDEIDGVLLVAAWFRRYSAEKGKLLVPAAARAACLGERPA